MEKEILEIIKRGLGTALGESLSRYNGPLPKLVDQVLEKHHSELYSLIDGEVVSLISSEEFKRSLKEALNQKLAKTLISRMGGEMESQINKLKADPTTRAKITVAIDRVISEL